MTQVISKHRDELRYEIAGEHTVTLMLDPDDPRSESLVFPARLLNLSARGAKLALPAPLPTHETLRLKLAIPQWGMELYSLTRVCWSAASETGEHQVGCRLSPGIPTGLLSQLSAGGRLDRREMCHQQDGFRFQFIRESDPAHARTWGTLLNYSPGGFCMQTATSTMQPGDRIHVLLEQPEAAMLVAATRWQMQFGDEYYWGCRYLGGKAAERFQRAVEAMSPGSKCEE